MRKQNLAWFYFLTKDGDEFDTYKNVCLRMTHRFVGKKKRFLSTKDEVKDLYQDCILAFLESKEEFDNKKGSFYGLFHFKLKKLEQEFVAKYLGLGMSYQDYLKSSQEGIISIYKLPLYDEYYNGSSVCKLGIK